jgi:hypothetical protein
MKTYPPPQSGVMLVYVSAYTRIRFGKLEHVRAHYRSSPQT